MDASGFSIIESSLKDVSNETMLVLTLKWSVECCIKHEFNREVHSEICRNSDSLIRSLILNLILLQKFLTSKDVLNALKELMEKKTISPDVLRVLCKLFQTFVLNDDIRAHIPMSHKHACQLSNEFLNPLVSRLRGIRRLFFCD